MVITFALFQIDGNTCMFVFYPINFFSNQLISTHISRAEPEYMNIPGPNERSSFKYNDCWWAPSFLWLVMRVEFVINSEAVILKKKVQNMFDSQLFSLFNISIDNSNKFPLLFEPVTSPHSLLTRACHETLAFLLSNSSPYNKSN